MPHAGHFTSVIFIFLPPSSVLNLAIRSVFHQRRIFACQCLFPDLFQRCVSLMHHSRTVHPCHGVIIPNICSICKHKMIRNLYYKARDSMFRKPGHKNTLPGSLPFGLPGRASGQAQARQRTAFPMSGTEGPCSIVSSCFCFYNAIKPGRSMYYISWFDLIIKMSICANGHP